LTRKPDLVARAHRRLNAAQSIEAVLAEVALFLQELPHARIEEMATDCRPRRIATQEDVTHWSQRLDRQRMLGASGSRSRGFCTVHDFFAHAAAQVQRLRPRRDYQPPVVIPRRTAPPWLPPSVPPRC
jgi:non-ribosomal peptide synthetase component F